MTIRWGILGAGDMANKTTAPAMAMAPQRIIRPMVRGADGVLAETSWTEALTAAAQGLTAAREGGIGVLAGGRLTVEDAYAYGKFARIALRDRADLLVRDLRDLDGGETAYLDLITALERIPQKQRGTVLAEARVSQSPAHPASRRPRSAGTIPDSVSSWNTVRGSCGSSGLPPRSIVPISARNRTAVCSSRSAAAC